jgi:SAM-dependent methyltransferase
VAPSSVPIPPYELAKRGTALGHAKNPEGAYEQIGAATRESIVRLLPEGQDLEGRRLLDFGCGAGRTLRHFLGEAESAEVWGCDIDEESIQWLRANLCPPLHVFRNDPQPPLPFPDGHFHVAWALSVFTHIVDNWAAWLLELHRVLADDGFLIATTLGPEHSLRFAHEPWDESRIGMNALQTWARYPNGAPVVLHSTWWLRAHWGRAFEIVEIEEPGGAPKQRVLAMKKRNVHNSVADLEAPEPGEPREYTAVAHNVQQLRRELNETQERLNGVRDRLARHRRREQKK